LVDGRRNLKTLLQDSFLALKTDVTGPFHDTAKVAVFREDITTNFEVTGILGKEMSMLGLEVLSLGGFGRRFLLKTGKLLLLR
jgi:hypothetical protein